MKALQWLHSISLQSTLWSLSESEKDVGYKVHEISNCQVFVGCDNYYHGSLLPCLTRPWLPPFSYRVQELDNGEVK